MTRFKLDENFGPSAKVLFVARGLDCHLAREEQLGGASDDEILAAAIRERRVLVTMDRDFTDVIAHPPAPTCGVVVISPGRAASRRLLESMIGALLDATAANAIEGALWIVEPGRIRIHERLDAPD